MAPQAGGPYSCAMVSGKFDEHAALVALLRAQPDGLSWPEIAAELLEAGSAVQVWDRHAPAPALIDLPDEITPDSVAEDLRSWQAHGYRLLSILDDDYPVRLRGVQQAPPIIFTLGSVSRRRSGCLRGRIAGGFRRGSCDGRRSRPGADGAAHDSGFRAGARNRHCRAPGGPRRWRPYRRSDRHRDRPRVPGGEPRAAERDRRAGGWCSRSSGRSATARSTRSSCVTPPCPATGWPPW